MGSSLDARFSLREESMERGGNSDGDIAEASKPASDGDVVPTVGDVVPEVLVPESHFTGKDANAPSQEGYHEKDSGNIQDLFSSSELHSAYLFAFADSADKDSACAEFLSFKKLLKAAATLVNLGEFYSQIEDRLQFLQVTLPGVMKKCLDRHEEVMFRCDDSNVHIFETLCDLLELVVVALSQPRSAFCTSFLTGLLRLLTNVLDSTSRYHSLKTGGATLLTVHADRLENMLLVPGFGIIEYGDATGRVQFFCKKKNSIGTAGCACCVVSKANHSELSYLATFFAQPTYGNGYEYALGILKQPEPFSVEVIEAVLGALSKLALSMPLKVAKGVAEVCEDLLVYVEADLKNLIGTSEFVNFKAKKKQAEKIRNHLLAIVRSLTTHHPAESVLTQWGCRIWKIMLRVPRLWTSALEEVMELLESLQKAELVMDAPTAKKHQKSYGSLVRWLQWLEKESHISAIIEMGKSRTDLHQTKVGSFFKLLITEKQLQDHHLTQIWTCKAPPNLDVQVTPAFEKLRAEVLEYLLETPCSLLERQLEIFVAWLEDIRGTCHIADSRMLTILKGVALCDKQRAMKDRTFSLFWALLSRNYDLAYKPLAALTEILAHYGSVEPCSVKDVDSIRASLGTSEGKANFLDALVKADEHYMGSQTRLRCKFRDSDNYKGDTARWNEEIDALLSKAKDRMQGMEYVFLPEERINLAKKSLQQLELFATLSSGIKTSLPASSIQYLEEMELRTLEALKCESKYQLSIATELDKLLDTQARSCDALQKRQHNEMMKFLHNSVTEREAVLQKAMLLKATVMTRNNEAKRLPVDSNTTVLRKAVTLLQEVEAKHEEEKLKKKRMSDDLKKAKDNKECAVCMEGFTKRKRACFSPCGHASVCVVCAKQEWERTKMCPMCKVGLDRKPVTLPSNLFF